MCGRLFGRRSQPFAIGAVLCLLAALFAFEAKLAWFSPDGTPYAQISAAKALPTDAPTLIAQVLATPPVSQHFPSDIPLLLAFAFFIPLIHWGFVVSEVFIRPVSPRFSPHLFRRPPPQY
jgi:hypothetical protein